MANNHQNQHYSTLFILTGVESSSLYLAGLQVKKGVRALRGYFGPLQEPKLKNVYSPISFDWFIRRLTEVKFRHLFKFYRCYGNKNGRQKRLKTEKLPFGPNLRLLKTDFLRNRNTKKYF